jgi:hypothetical protein
MIVVLARGNLCPKDHQQHAQLVSFYPQIVAGYTQIVTISTDSILVSNDFRAAVGAQWVFLSDAGRKVQRDLDIQEYTDPHNSSDTFLAPKAAFQRRTLSPYPRIVVGDRSGSTKANHASRNAARA